MNRALFHLARRDATRAALRQRLARRALQDMGVRRLPAEVERSIEAVLDRLAELGYLDDARFAATRARSLHGAGRSTRWIRHALTGQGLGEELVAGAVNALGGGSREALDLRAAVTLARRRRLGPWRPEEERAATLPKDAATMARVGFPTAVVLKVLKAPTPEALEEELRALDELEAAERGMDEGKEG